MSGHGRPTGSPAGLGEGRWPGPADPVLSCVSFKPPVLGSREGGGPLGCGRGCERSDTGRGWVVTPALCSRALQDPTAPTGHSRKACRKAAVVQGCSPPEVELPAGPSLAVGYLGLNLHP